MTTAVAALTAGYIALAVLLLSLNLTSLWRWWIKAGAIIATTIFFGVTFQALGGLTGWPTTQSLPARFAMVWSTVVEPDKKTNNPGGIYVWAQELDANNVPSTKPRSYQFPYSDALARQATSAQQKRDRGIDVMGVPVYENDPRRHDEPRSDIKMGQVNPNNEDMRPPTRCPSWTTAPGSVSRNFPRLSYRTKARFRPAPSASCQRSRSDPAFEALPHLTHNLLDGTSRVNPRRPPSKARLKSLLREPQDKVVERVWSSNEGYARLTATNRDIAAALRPRRFSACSNPTTNITCRSNVNATLRRP